MFARLDISFFSVVAALLLLTAPGRPAAVNETTNTNSTTASPVLTTQLSNSSVDKPLALGLHRSCGDEYRSFCGNGGQCMLPHDSSKPFCICKSSYSGPRCFSILQTGMSRSRSNVEQVIGILFGVLLVLLVLVFLLYCCCYRKCKKSASLIKSAPSETSV